LKVGSITASFTATIFEAANEAMIPIPAKRPGSLYKKINLQCNQLPHYFFYELIAFMQKNILFLLLLIVSTKNFCQKTVFIEKYAVPATIKPGQVIVQMPFGYAAILTVFGDTAGLKTAGDIFIDVACTDYPINASLVSLNKSRITSFLKRFPFVKESQLAQVNFFQQTDGELKEKAITMFHGLIIKFRPGQSVENAKVEVVKLEEIVKTGTPVPATKPAIAAKKKDSDNTDPEKLYAQKPRRFQNGTWYIQVGRVGIASADYNTPKKMPLDSFITRDPKDALEEGLINKLEYKEFKRSTAIRIYYPRWLVLDSVLPKKPATVVEKPVIVTKTNKIPDSSILKILDRTGWENATIVADVTGSMYKYTAQVLLWVKSNPIGGLTKNFVFFNDGDNMPDKDKKLGNTGGIYSRSCNSYAEVETLMKTTMLKGGGGDYPENNIEALLKAEKDFPSAGYQVMIADNWAAIKDKALWQHLTKPVRIVVCGATEFNVHIDYLNLARKTKGSVHLMESDLYNLSGLREGEILKVGKNSFIVKNGMFVEKGYDVK
jgi:hypothetical protein